MTDEKTPDPLGSFDDALSAGLKRWSIPIDADRLGRLRAHYQAMVETNRTVNLTRIVEPTEAACKHYVDSLALILWADSADTPQACRLLDVGTGAGLPAVPLAVMRREWTVTAIDSTRKKIDFLRRLTDELGLDNLAVVHARAEHWNVSERFHIVTSRAVARLSKGLGQSARLVAPGGYLVAYKTASTSREETDEANEQTRKLNLVAKKPFDYDLVVGDEVLHRRLLIYRKKR